MMREIAIALNILCTISECFWIYCIIDILFKRRFWEQNKWYLILFNVLCSTLIILMMNQRVLTSPWTLTMWIFYGVLSVCIFWRCDFFDAVAVIGTYCFCLLIFGNIQISITGLIGGNQLIEATTMQYGIHRVIYLLISGPIWFGLSFIFYKWLKKRGFLKNRHKYFIWMTLSGMIGGIFITNQMLSNFSIELNTIWYLFCIIIVLFVYGLILWEKSEIYKFQVTSLEKHNELLEKSYKQINDTYIENAELYHDMKHHFNSIYRLVEQEDLCQAKEYIENITEPVMFKNVIRYTGIELLDVILQEMEQKARRNGITLIFEAQQLPQEISIKQKDLCALYVNLLENAIEASKSKVYLSIKQINKMMFITIKNDYRIYPVIRNGNFITDKKDTEKHGWGTKIIKQVVEKYNGDIKYKVDDECVSIEIMLNDI